MIVVYLLVAVGALVWVRAVWTKSEADAIAHRDMNVMTKRALEHDELAAVRAAFLFLERDHGFRIESERFDYQCFGNIAVKYQRGPSHLTIVRDRSQWLPMVGLLDRPLADRDLMHVLAALHRKDEVALLEGRGYSSLEDTTRVIERNLAAIITYMESPSTRSGPALVEP